MVEDDGLERFVLAQDAGGIYEQAVGELAAGKKRSHWMWFVFPQLRGLGRSELAYRFGIDSLSQATAYLAHPVLGPRLLLVTALVATSPVRSAEELFGAVDVLKLRSSMTLFLRAAPEESSFVSVLDRYYLGKPDPLTDALL